VAPAATSDDTGVVSDADLPRLRDIEARVGDLRKQTYIWVRWVAKIWLWYWYLRLVSRFKLSLVAGRAAAVFREKATLSAKRIEERWLNTPYAQDSEAAVRRDVSQLRLLGIFYKSIQAMRVVPFDLRSVGQLIGSAVGPLVPLIPYFFQLEGPWKEVFDVLLKWLPGR